MHAIRTQNSRNKAPFVTLDRPDRIRDTTARYKSAFAVHPVRKWTRRAVAITEFPS